MKDAGQRVWQILPLNPTGYGDSPYQSCSTYAGNHYLIDLDTLVEEGLLKAEEVTAIHWGDEYSMEPNDSQKAIARQLSDAGADIIIGNHTEHFAPFFVTRKEYRLTECSKVQVSAQRRKKNIRHICTNR